MCKIAVFIEKRNDGEYELSRLLINEYFRLYFKHFDKSFRLEFFDSIESFKKTDADIFIIETPYVFDNEIKSVFVEIHKKPLVLLTAITLDDLKKAEIMSETRFLEVVSVIRSSHVSFREGNLQVYLKPIDYKSMIQNLAGGVS